jgi:hypothetical protein
MRPTDVPKMQVFTEWEGVANTTVLLPGGEQEVAAGSVTHQGT